MQYVRRVGRMGYLCFILTVSDWKSSVGAELTIGLESQAAGAKQQDHIYPEGNLHLPYHRGLDERIF